MTDAVANHNSIQNLNTIQLKLCESHGRLDVFVCKYNIVVLL